MLVMLGLLGLLGILVWSITGCSSRRGVQLVPGPATKDRWWSKQKHSNAGAIRVAERAGVVQVHAACVEVHAQLPTIESPVCGLRLCISSRLQPTKRLRVQTGAPPSAGPPRPNTPRGNHQQPGGAAPEPQENHSGTQSSHLKFTDRAVSRAEQERLKM